MSTVSSIQESLKYIHLTKEDNKRLIEKIMSTIRSTVNNPGTKGSVQVLNNLQTILMKKKREDEGIHDNKTFYENIFSFLT
jgi:hypothetical protein